MAGAARLLMIACFLPSLLLGPCGASDGESASNSHQTSREDLERTVGVQNVRGRLGNHLWGYMQALGLSMAFPIKVMITRETKTALEQYFQHVRLEAVEEASCGWNEHHAAFLSYVDGKVLDWLEAKMGQRIELERGSDGRLQLPRHLAKQYPVSTNDLIRADPDFASGYKPDLGPNYDCQHQWEFYMENLWDLADPRWNKGKHLHLFPAGTKGNLTNLYRWPGVLDTFLEDIKFKEEYQASAQKRLHIVKEKHFKRLKEKGKNKKKRKINDNELVFVGIHSRRTDHLAYEERRGQAPIKTAYFLDAMHLFRKKFGKNKVAFVFVSDDMEWGREKLIPRNKERDLYMAGDGRTDQVDAVGSDLALLSACNHTIQSHGSFSYFAGALAGGLKVIPEHFAEHRGGSSAARGLAALAGDPLDPARALPRFHFFEEMRSQQEQLSSSRKDEL